MSELTKKEKQFIGLLLSKYMDMLGNNSCNDLEDDEREFFSETEWEKLNQEATKMGILYEDEFDEITFDVDLVHLFKNKLLGITDVDE